MKMRRILSILLVIAMLSAFIPMLALGISATENETEQGVTKTSDDGNYSIAIEKAEFQKGEPIYVTADGTNNTDWIGIGNAGTSSYIDYYYLGQSGFGAPYNILRVLSLEPGEYELFLVPNNGSNYSNSVVKELYFTVTEEEYAGQDQMPVIDIGDTTLLTTKNGQKEFKKGEPIYIAATGESGDWIGIYDDVYDEQYSSYVYISNMGGSGNYYDLNASGNMAPGTYFIRLMPSNAANTPYSVWAKAGIYITVTEDEYVAPDDEEQEELDPETGLPADFGINPSRMTLEKKIFKKGEPILVSAISTTDKDWVGIYADATSTTSLKYHYVTLADSGTFIDVASGLSLPAGNYLIRLVPNDQALAGNEANTIAGVWIVITDEEYVDPDEGGTENPDEGGTTDPDDPDVSSGVVISNGTHSMAVNKTQFEVGESIWVTATGVSTKDWIGIAQRGYTDGTIRWYYVASAGNGVAYDIRQAPNVGGSLASLASIPEGLYTIYLVENDQYLKDDWTFSINISVGNVEDAENGAAVDKDAAAEDNELLPPISATYEPNGASGYATGTVTVTMPQGQIDNRSIVMYWANASGRLEGYTAHARFKVTGENTSFTFGNSVIIPNGATHLHIYSQITSTELISDEYISIELPSGSDMTDQGKPNNSIWIISDIHIGRGNGEVSAENFKKMLNEAILLNPEGIAIFIVGDMADGGTEAQFAEMMSLHAQVMEANGKDESKYPLYLTLGNHDYPAMQSIFLQYATLPDGTHPSDTSYDFWLDGYHYIFLGSDTNSGLYANLSEETLSWLDTKLSECRDISRPTFVFLHQPMYNTVSGSLPGEGWDGVSNEDALRAVLKKYPEVMFFNGHTHWTMDSVGNIFEGNEDLPIHIFNCASVSYLWSGYNTVTGESLEGSQGYYVEMYDGKIFVRGRDFINSEWISSAQYSIELEQSENDGHSYTEHSLTYENGYLNSGKLVYKCATCGAEKVVDTAPIIVNNGYSLSTFNTSSICVGYVIDFELLGIYESLNNTQITIGLVASPYDNLVNAGKPINADGTVSEVTGGKIISYVLNRDYKYVDLILQSSDWTQYSDKPVVLCAYIIENDTVGYICDKTQITDTASSVTYSGLVSNE
ncbi:MAG: metallophosphoesterase [Clostridia bacterium]|nr:metallophosphoesterase [Clostridia bacterium]